MDQMDLGEYNVEPVITAVFRFIVNAIKTVEMLNLPLSLVENDIISTLIISFIVVKSSSAYNVILGRPALATLW